MINLGVGVHGVHGRRDVFRLPDLWQFHLYGYSADLTINGTTYGVRSGSVSLVPAGVQVEFAYRGRSEHLYCHFRPAAAGPSLALPVVQDARTAAPGLSDLLRQAIAASPGGTARVAAEVWTALWRVSQLGASVAEGDDEAGHPAVSAAV